MSKIEIDPKTGVPTTGHEFDGIKELNNKVPAWITFSIILLTLWAIGYAIYYPSIPSLKSHTKGISNYSPRIELEKSIQRAQMEQKQYYDTMEKKSVEEILQDDTLRTFAIRGGEVAFKNNCTACHGSGGMGAKGFPNLADDDWLWGGTPEQIEYTIRNGIRSPLNEDTRYSEMSMFDEETLDAKSRDKVVQYVLSIAGLKHDKDLAVAGEEIFEGNCSVCHGTGGVGGQEVGAPALNDAIWLRVTPNAKRISAQIQNPKMGVMPAWNKRLSDITIKMLVTYVYSLSGGR